MAKLFAKYVVEATVAHAEPVTPAMRRILLRTDHPVGFDYTPGQHIRIQLMDPLSVAGILRPVETLRTYTIWALSPDRRTIELRAHLYDGAGIGLTWAREANAGDRVTFWWPKGDFFTRPARYHLFVGEETASAAFGPMLRALDDTAEVYGVLESESPRTTSRCRAPGRWAGSTATASPPPTPACWSTRWPRSTCRPIAGAAYVAGEARTCQMVRDFLVRERAWPRTSIKVKPFWTPGSGACTEMGHHQAHDAAGRPPAQMGYGTMCTPLRARIAYASIAPAFLDMSVAWAPMCRRCAGSWNLLWADPVRLQPDVEAAARRAEADPLVDPPRVVTRRFEPGQVGARLEDLPAERGRDGPAQTTTPVGRPHRDARDLADSTAGWDCLARAGAGTVRGERRHLEAAPLPQRFEAVDVGVAHLEGGTEYLALGGDHRRPLGSVLRLPHDEAVDRRRRDEGFGRAGQELVSLLDRETGREQQFLQPGAQLTTYSKRGRRDAERKALTRLSTSEAVISVPGRGVA